MRSASSNHDRVSALIGFLPLATVLLPPGPPLAAIGIVGLEEKDKWNIFCLMLY